MFDVKKARPRGSKCKLVFGGGMGFRKECYQGEAAGSWARTREQNQYYLGIYWGCPGGAPTTQPDLQYSHCLLFEYCKCYIALLGQV